MRSAIRSLFSLRKNWKLTAIAVFSLSIAMALAVVSLSVSNTLLILPPAGVDPGRLVTIYSRAPDEPIGEISYPDYKYFRENSRVFTDIAAAPNSISVNFQMDEHGEVRIVSRPVSENYFVVLGLRPFLGRLFAPGDDQSNPPVAVMTYACWKRLGSDPKIAGRQIAGHTIIGVAPKEFTGSLYGLDGDLVRALSGVENTKDWMSQRDSRRLVLLARLKPGVSRRQAQAEMTALAAQLSAAYPKEDKNRAAVLTRASLLPPGAMADAEMATAIVMALVLLVLLIACANVANLLLSAAVGRQQESAIKLALGAPRGRLIGEFLWDSGIVCASGGALGYAIAALAIARYSIITIPLPMYGSYSIGLNLHLDATVMAATLALVAIATLSSGLAPGLYASSPRLAQTLSGEIVVGGTGKNARRNALVAVQIAVCTLVLVGMGLCQRNLYNLHHVDTGFSARNLVAETVMPKNEGFSDPRGKQLYDDLRREVSAVPGVEAVTLASELPLSMDGGDGDVPVQYPDGGKKISIGEGVVDDRYFSTIGMRVLAGRTFNSGDREGGPDVIVINQKMAEMFWPGLDPVGKTVLIGEPARTETVAGVVANGKYGSLDEDTKPFFCRALSQHYRGAMRVIARTKGDPRLWVEPLARTVRKLGLMAPMRPATYGDWMGVTILPDRIAAACLEVLGGLALLLALMGLSGAISYSVSERKKELGIRVALGARPWHLAKMIVCQTCWVAGAGIVSGIGLGVAGTISLRSQFFGIGAVEWTVLVPVSAGMLGVALAVAYLSAKPWISVDPLEAVRHA
jgi:predicted permease